ncbi:MAG: hypothetical protein NTV34_03610 [Proteobacteria bacterium]|nr:hypothetical protein [Pseudomonadota bacterium]
MNHDTPKQKSKTENRDQESTTLPHGLKGVAPEPPVWTPELAFGLTIGGVLLCLIFWLGLVWQQRRKRVSAVVETSALEALSLEINLLAKPVIARSASGISEGMEQGKEEFSAAWLQFSSNVNLLLRKLMGEFSGKPCADWTSDEVESFLVGKWQHEQEIPWDEAVQVLRSTDTVRFAGKVPQNIDVIQWEVQLKVWNVRLQRLRSHGI